MNPFFDEKLKRVTAIPRTAYFELTLWKDLSFEFSPYYNSIKQPFAEKTAGEEDYLYFFTDQKDKIMRKTKEVYCNFVETLKKQIN